MKSATLPPVRLRPELRDDMEASLAEGETVSAFVSEAVRQYVVQRQADRSWVARAWAARETLQQGGAWETPESLLGDLRQRLDHARRRSDPKV